MELTIQTRQNGDTIRIELAPITGAIILIVTEGEYSSRIFLSAFEAQIIGGALLQMNSKLEYPHDVMDIEAEEKAAKQEAVKAIEVERNDMITHELIAEIGFNTLAQGKYHKYLKLASDRLVLVADDVWEKEIKHLQGDYERGVAGVLNIKKDAEGNWWLVDTLPF